MPEEARRPGRPTRQQAGLVRESIVDAALQTFLAHGFEAASMERIARSARVSKLTLYRHFESKPVLFVEVLQRAQLRVRNSLGDAIDPSIPLETALRTIIERLYDGFTHPDYLAIMRLAVAESQRFPKLGRAMLNDAKTVVGPLTDYIQSQMDSGRIAVESAYDAATQVTGLASGAGRYILVPPSRRPTSRRRTVESLVRLFTRSWEAGTR